MEEKQIRLSVDDFLARQSEHEFLATIEPVKDDPDLVKLTPWLPTGGCLCQYALNIPKDNIESLHPTGDRHVCCGKVLRVAGVQFKEGATIQLDRLFEQVAESSASASGMSSAPGMPTSATGMLRAAAGQSAFLPQQGSAAAALGNALRRSTSLGQPDPACVADCGKTQAACLAACRFAGAGGLGGYALCAAACFALGQACTANCYPLFPDDIFQPQSSF